MTYNVLMGMLNPTHSLTHSLTHSPGSHLGLPVQPHLILMPLEVDTLEPKQLDPAWQNNRLLPLSHINALYAYINYKNKIH